MSRSHFCHDKMIINVRKRFLSIKMARGTFGLYTIYRDTILRLSLHSRIDNLFSKRDTLVPSYHFLPLFFSSATFNRYFTVDVGPYCELPHLTQSPFLAFVISAAHVQAKARGAINQHPCLSTIYYTLERGATVRGEDNV